MDQFNLYLIITLSIHISKHKATLIGGFIYVFNLFLNYFLCNFLHFLLHAFSFCHKIYLLTFNSDWGRD